MSNVSKYGETSWGDVVTDSGNSSEKKDYRETFLRLEKGPNIVRIITPPFQYMVHKYKAEGDTGYGTRIMCSKLHGECAVCALGDSPKRRWFLGAIDRRSGSYKILDVSVAVLKPIQALTREDDYGDPSRYDINIKADPNGSPATYYSVLPKLPKPMSADDIEIRDMVDLEDLRKRSTPPTPEKVAERLNKYLSNLNGTPVQASRPQQTRAPAPVARPAPVVEADDSGDAPEFPDYENEISFSK